MTLEAIQQDHKKTQNKIDSNARDRHFKSSGRWENEKSLAETINDLNDRLTKLENLTEIINELISNRNADDNRSHGSGSGRSNEVIQPREFTPSHYSNHIDDGDGA